MEEEILNNIDSLKELAAAILESVLRCFREPCVIYPQISKEQFIKYLKSKACHFYEDILGWPHNYYFEQIKKSGILNEQPPHTTRLPSNPVQGRRKQNESK